MGVTYRHFKIVQEVSPGHFVLFTVSYTSKLCLVETKDKEIRHVSSFFSLPSNPVSDTIITSVIVGRLLTRSSGEKELQCYYTNKLATTHFNLKFKGLAKLQLR